MQTVALLQVLFLLLVANGTPVLLKRVLGPRYAYPLDFGIRFFDGQPLFGSSKTFRGILLSVPVTAGWAPVIGVEWRIGATIGAVAMAGDLFSSFVKRRLRLPPSSQATGLDQIPESLFPLLACRSALALTAADVAAGVAIFFVGEILLSRLLFRLGIRNQPY